LVALQLVSWIATIAFFIILYQFLYPNLRLATFQGNLTSTGPAGGSVTTTPPSAFLSFAWLSENIIRGVNALVYFYTSTPGVALFYVILLAAAFLNEISYVPLAIYHARLVKKREERLNFASGYPLVSVIVPAHDEEKTIEATVLTLRESNYPNLEIIVVNDGSTDRTKEVLLPYALRRDILLLNRPEAGGKAVAFNTGAAAAGGDILVMIDADVALARDAVRKLTRHFEDPIVAAASGNVKVGNRVNILTRLQALEYIRDLNIRRRALELLQSIIVVPGACGAFRKAALYTIGTMDRDTVVEDMDATIRLVKTGQDIRFEPHSMAYTEAPETISAWARQRRRWYGGGWQTLSKHRENWWKFGPLSAFGYPSLFLSMFFSPIIELVTLSMIFLYLFSRLFYGVFLALVIVLITEFFMAGFAIAIDHEDWKLLLYVPIYVVIYRILVDVVRIHGYFLAATGRLGWYRTGRYGGILERMRPAQGH
jgi:cellulose synthase/poly-beta-1,6-N-acetylglucosamine synthase-like glycosyltransferase